MTDIGADCPECKNARIVGEGDGVRCATCCGEGVNDLEKEVNLLDDCEPETIQALKDRGGTWGVYTNQAFDHSQFGHKKFLRYGEGCTFAEPPKRMPDTDKEINWAYQLVGTIDAGEI
jgi:hypothetical protein